MPKKETKVWEKDELKREEVRGIFAIGMVALIFAMSPYSPEFVVIISRFVPANLLEMVISTFRSLGFLWGAYIFSVAISLSEEIEELFGEKFCSTLKGLAKMFFLFGSVISIIFFSIYVISAFWQFFLLVLVLAGIFVMYEKLLPHLKKLIKK